MRLLRACTCLTLAVLFPTAAAASPTPILRLTGLPAERSFGIVSSAGDFNGDGKGDFAVGSSARVCVFYGGSALDSIPDLVLTPASGSFGLVSGGGDFNADGYSDLAVGRFGGVLLRGVLLYLGGVSPASQPAVTLSPSFFSLAFGSIVTANSDLNGDGYSDVVVSDLWFMGPVEPSLGRVFVYEGAPISNSTIPFFLDPLPSRGGFDFGLRTATGDFNGDGRGDVLVTEGGNSDTLWSRLYCFTGTGCGFAPPTFVHAGFPIAVVGLGDLNGDGCDEAAVTGRTVTCTMTEPGLSCTSRDGAVLIYSGANLSAGVSIPWMVLRAGNNGSFGLSIAGGRDVNGDGSPDIVIGSPDHGMGPSGRVYVYFGGASLDTIPDVVLEGEPSFGDCVALQDVTGDGVAEVIVGADAYPWRGLGDRGHAYVYDLARPLAARSFVHGAQRSVPIGESREPLWIQMEPVGGTYANEAVDWSSLQLHLPESATAIHPLSGKGVIEEDSDHNGILELRIGFSATDLARLVTEPGRHVVTLDVDGRTLSGRALQSSLEVTLVRTGGKAPLRASVQPNPLNPSGEIVFATAREGRSTLRVYDVTGRLLREISQTSAAGTQRIAFDGRDQQGRSLASGIYLYRIHAPDGDQRGRFTIAK